MKNLQKKIKDYEAICEEIAEIFCEKQEFQFDGWIGDRPGEIACCSDLYFAMSDIIFDLQNNVKKGKIIKWLDTQKSYNYRSFLKLESKI